MPRVRLQLGILLACGVAAGASAAPLPLEDCQLQSTVARGSAKARCGWYEVAENRAAPDGKRIRIRVAVIPALRKTALPDPVVIISGGPGQAAGDFYLSSAFGFERLRRDRDIVVIDQRGTGESQRLDCKLPDELESTRFDVEMIQRYTRECLKQLNGDPRFYTTSVAVQDLEEIRAALGYSTLNLYGVSYGTRVAQHYARRFSHRVRSIVLDGVVPMELALGPDIAIAAQSTLDAILKRCHQDPACRRAYPRLAEELAELLARLSARPVPLVVADPSTAIPQALHFDQSHLAVALRLHSYSDETAALLPFLIHEAAQNRLQPIAAQALMIARDLNEQFANGMHNAVVCSEDVPFLDPEAVRSSAIDATFLRRVFLDSLQATCAVWPRGEVDPDFHAPLQSNVPALLLSGENDPVTPAAYGELAAKGFQRGKHLVFAGQGHGQLTSTCGASIVRRFVEAGSAESLDTECLARVTPAPFFLDANGPAP